MFVLPPAYRPGFFDISGLAHGIVVAPDAGAELSGHPIPPGGVESAIADVAVLDGVTFEAAGGAKAAAKAKVSLGTLEKLAGQ